MKTFCEIDLSNVKNKKTIKHTDGSEVTLFEALPVSEPSLEEKSILAQTAFVIGNLQPEKW
jgi:hypothetical protein